MAEHYSMSLNYASALNFERTGNIVACLNEGMAETKPRRELIPIANRLIATREAMGYVGHGAQAEYCREVGLKPNRYNQWEKARIRPTEKGLSKLRKRHGITYEWIWEGDPKGLPYALASKLKLPA